MKYDDPIVEKEAKKHKKIFETFDVNPGSYRINENEYFMVNYLRGEKMKGCAVISPNSQAGKNEYLLAFNSLLEHAESISLILNHGGERANANMHAFTTMQQFLSDVLNEVADYLTPEIKDVFEFCLNRINLILKFHERLQDIFQSISEKIDKYFDGEKENFTKQDMREEANYLGEIGYIQYRQIMAIYEFIPKFRYIQELNNLEVDKYITTLVKKYLAEFSKGEKEQLKNIEHVTYQNNMEELTREEHIELEKEVFFKNLEETNALSRRELRYPKL